MCQILCESRWTGPAARRDDEYVHEAIEHGRRAINADRLDDADTARAEATQAAHAARRLLDKFGWNHLLTESLYRLHFQLELHMSRSEDPTHNICLDYLELLRNRGTPEGRLLITSNNWGYIRNLPISYAIIERWMVNQLLERVSESSRSLWQLSQRGLDLLEGRLRQSELVWPERKYVIAPMNVFEQDDAPVAVSAASKRGAAVRSSGEPFTEADELFSAAGNCRLCGKNSHVFGMISHAKSKHGATYEATGQVQLVTRRKKTVAIILGEVPADAPAESVSIGVTETTNVTVYPKRRDVPAARPKEPAKPIDLGDITKLSPDEILRLMGAKK